MKIKQKLILSFTGIALLVGIVGYFSLLLSNQVMGLKTTELPMEQALREVEVGIWETNHAADSFRLSGSNFYKELYYKQIEKVEEFLPQYANLTDTEEEKQFLKEFQILWEDAKVSGNKMIELAEKQKSAEDAFFVNVDEADDVIDFEIQGKWKPTDPYILEKEQAVREVEVSIWEAIHAGQQFTGLSGNIVRGGQKYLGNARDAAKRGADASLVKGDFADLMERQFEDVEKYWTLYKSLPLESIEKEAIKEFDRYWEQAVKAGREVVSLYDQSEEQFNTLFTKIKQADNVIDFKMQEFIQKRIEHEDKKSKQVKTEAIIACIVTVICAIAIGTSTSRSICRPVNELKKAVAEIKKGHWNITIENKTNDEIGVFAASFERMVKHLKKTINSLNKEIAERKNAEKRLIDSEEKYREQFEGVIDAIFLADCRTGILLDCNQAALKLVGKEKTEIVGHHQSILHPSEDLKGEFSESFETHLKGDNGIVAEAKVVTKSGEIKDVAIKASLLEINGKKVLQGIFRDITENKRKEKELQRIQEELIKTSHRAGMAEVATDVLHNVGNVLNSVNVSVSLIRDKVSNSEIENLEKVADMIIDHVEDLGVFLTEDQRGKHVPAYLKQATKLLVDRQKEVSTQLQSLTKNVEHIKEIVRTQQAYAKTGGVQMPTILNDVIKDAIEINHEGLKRYGIEFKLELTELPKIYADKQRILQILVNLINNAKYAMSESGNPEKILIIRCYRHEEDIRIEVIDNGIGIPQNNLIKVFQHGFTTRENGHGFGLHSGALAAKEMGGALNVRSDGAGQGATFILELPFKPTGVELCAI